MSEQKLRIGKKVMFRNRAHYPSLDGRFCEIVSDYGNDGSTYRYGVQFDATPGRPAFRMAASASELQIA